MNPFARKPQSSSTETNNEQVQPSEPNSVGTGQQSTYQQPAVPAPVVKKHSRAFSFVSILFLLALLGAGVMTYLWYDQVAQVNNLNQEVAQLKTDLETLQTRLNTVDSRSSVLDVAPSDEELIRQSLTSYYHSIDKENTGAKVDVLINKQIEEFANVTLRVDGSYRSGCILKKSSLMWTVLYCGTGAPQSSDVERWGAPETVIISEE